MKHTALTLLLMLAGCASTPPAPVEYLLRPPLSETPSAPTAEPARVALGRLQIAPYLDQTGIVIATGDHRIEVAQDHRWAEPLSHSLRRMLQVDIAKAAGEPVAENSNEAGYQGIIVDVNVHRLHGSLDGKVMIDADWQLRDSASGALLGRYRFAHTALTQAPGYAALVQAHVVLLGDLSKAIAESLPPSGASPPTTGADRPGQ